MGPIAGRLTDRIGPRPLMTARPAARPRLAVLAGPPGVDTRYGFLVGAFVLMGLGMGLVMSPMSTAAMNAVEQTKAGVASGMLSMSRMVGGTFGVAAMGALITALGRSRARPSCCPALPAERATSSPTALGAGGGAAGPARARAPSSEAFVYALNDGLRIARRRRCVGARRSPGR